MADYIRRDYALHNIECGPWDTETDRNRAIHYVRELTPAANVRPVVMGEWLMPNADKTDRPMPECSVCGWYVTEEAAMEFTFCPNCGAEMITGKEEKGRT